MRSTHLLLFLAASVAAVSLAPARVAAQETTAEEAPAEEAPTEEALPEAPSCADAKDLKSCKASCEERFGVEEVEEQEKKIDPSLRTHGWITLSVGGALLITGAATGIAALTLNSTLDDECPDGSCPPGRHDDLDTRDNLSTVSTITLATGLAVSVVGILVLAVFAPNENDGVSGSALTLAPTLGRREGGAALLWRF